MFALIQTQITAADVSGEKQEIYPRGSQRAVVLKLHQNIKIKKQMKVSIRVMGAATLREYARD